MEVIEPKLRKDRYYNHAGKEFQCWFTNAIKMQNQYVIERRRLEIYDYEKTEPYAGAFAGICESIFGFRNWNNCVPKLGRYSNREIEHTCKILNTILNIADNKSAVIMDIIYVSILIGENPSYFAIEWPVFVVVAKDGSDRYVDPHCSSFDNVRGVIGSLRKRFNGCMMYPRGLKNVAASGEKVQLMYMESPFNSLETLRSPRNYAKQEPTVKTEIATRPLLIKMNLACYEKVVELVLLFCSNGCSRITAHALALSRSHHDMEWNIFVKLQNVNKTEALRLDKIHATLITNAAQAAAAEKYNYVHDGTVQKITVRWDFSFEIMCQSNYQEFMEHFHGVHEGDKKRKSQIVRHGIVDVFALNDMKRSKIKKILNRTKIRLEKQLQTNQAKQQFYLLLTENQGIKERSILFQNLVKIADKNHFLHITYEILRPKDLAEKSPTKAKALTTIYEDSAFENTHIDVQQRFRNNEEVDVNAASHSGLHFSPNMITINGSLSIAPEAYNTVGDDSVRCAFAPLLKKEEEKALIHDRICQLYADGDDNELFNFRIEITNFEKTFKLSRLGYSKPFYDGLSQYIQYMQRNLKKNEEYIKDFVFNDAVRRYIQYLELNEAVCGTELNPGSLHRNRQIVEFYEMISMHAPYRKVNLIHATKSARAFEESLIRFDEFFKGERNGELLRAANAVRYKMYARSRNNRARNSATASQYKLVKDNYGEKALRDLEDMAARMYSIGKSFSGAQYERLSFKYHVHLVNKILSCIFQCDDLDAIILSGKRIFNEMTIDDYDRLRRVFDETTFENIEDSAVLCNHDSIAPHVQTPDDFVCVIELRKLGIETPNELMEKISEVESVNTLDNWRSILSKTYHYNKHEAEFREGGDKCTPQDFFNKHAESIFHRHNLFNADLFTQSGKRRQFFYRVTSNYTHVGFISADAVNSHYRIKRKLHASVQTKIVPAIIPLSQAPSSPVPTRVLTPARLPRSPQPPQYTNPRGWLLLKNQGNDCFLNATVQLLRRIDPLRTTLVEWLKGVTRDRKSLIDTALSHLAVLFLPHKAAQAVGNLRKALLAAIPSLEQQEFVTSQQDASEVLQALLQILPDAAKTPMLTTTKHQLRCFDKTEEDCGWRRTPDEAAPFVIYPVGADHEEVNLEDVLCGEWRDEEAVEVHCPSCCACCRESISENNVHDDDNCDCLSAKSRCRRQVKTEFTGAGDYFCLTLNILHRYADGSYSRKDWALTENCDLKRMRMFGRDWRAVAIIKHREGGSKQWQAGHYYTYVLEDDDEWWKHDDRKPPESIGRTYSLPSGHTYAEGCTDMEGVTVVLFQVIRD